jgi:hypothetical protein
MHHASGAQAPATRAAAPEAGPAARPAAAPRPGAPRAPASGALPTGLAPGDVIPLGRESFQDF